MHRSSTTAARPWRAAVVGALLGALAVATPASAAGTGGIEVTPDPPVVDGEQATSFRVDVPDRGEQQVPFTLRNVEDERRSARVYAARVSKAQDGTLSLGEAGSSRFVSLQDSQVTLEAGEVRPATFTVEGGELSKDDVLAAVVVEVRTGSVVQRASTLVYLERGRQLPLPLLLVVAAVVLVMVTGAGVAVLARRRSARPPAGP